MSISFSGGGELWRVDLSPVMVVLYVVRGERVLRINLTEGDVVSVVGTAVVR